MSLATSVRKAVVESTRAAFRESERRANGSDEPLRVGASVWVYDENRRAYSAPKPGRSWGDLIPRSQWARREIVGETSRSWLLGGGLKLPKRPPLPSWVLLTDDALDLWCWAKDHRHRIAERIMRDVPLDVVALVARAIGYDTPPPAGGGA